MAGLRIRVVSWNVDSRPTGLLDAKVDLLRRLRPDLVLLQEINRPIYRALLPHPSAHERMHRRTRLFSWGALSTDLADRRGSGYRLGCAVLGVPTTALLDSRVLDGAAFGVCEAARAGFLWRTMTTRVALSSGDLLTVGSFHGRQSASRPATALQRAFHTGIAGWLAHAPGPAIMGIDTGAPIDVADPLLGAQPRHDLHGVLRSGHDHLWTTSDLTALDVTCLADEAAAVGSDHPLLLADLELRDP